MRLQICFLGTSASVPTKRRGLPCIALKYRGEILLLDVGEGAQARLIRAGLSPMKVKAVFITHLHGDHVFGLPGLLQTMAMLGRSEPLSIYGPKGLRDFIYKSFELTGFKPQFDIYFHGPPGVYEVNDYVVRSFTVDHVTEAYGYVFEEKRIRGRFNPEKAKQLKIPLKYWRPLRMGKLVTLNDGRIIRPQDVIDDYSRGAKIVYTGDTRPIDKIITIAKECDVLIHDSTFASELRKEAYKEGHSTSLDAALIASKANAKVLILTHVSARYHDNPSILLHDARRYFSNTFLAEDYMIYILM